MLLLFKKKKKICVLSTALLHTIPGNGYISSSQNAFHHNHHILSRLFIILQIYCIVVQEHWENMLYRHLNYHYRKWLCLDTPVGVFFKLSPLHNHNMNHSHHFANEVPQHEDVLFIISDVCQLSIKGGANLFKNWGSTNLPPHHHHHWTSCKNSNAWSSKHCSY